MADVRSEPIGRLVRQHPAWVAVLEEFGIDGRGGTSHTLLAATDQAGVDIEAVLAAMAGAPRSQIACERVGTVSLRLLVDHVEQVHHVRTRELLVRLHRALGDSDGEPSGHDDPARDGPRRVAEQAAATLAERLEQHLVTEELLLFPLCRDLLDAFSWPSFHVGPLDPSLDHVHHDHHELDAQLDAVADAVTQVGGPDGAEHPALAVLEELRADLERHLHEEETLLLPAARRLAEELAVG